MVLHAGKNVLDVFDGEHDATYAERVRRCVSWLSADRHRLVEFHELKAAVTVRGPHHCDVDLGAVESDDAIYPTSLDYHLALQLQTECDKEGDSRFEVFENNADVVHSLDRHVSSSSFLSP